MSSSSDSDINSDNSDINSDNGDGEQRNQIREELRSMSFEEIMKLKEKLGAKVYKEAVLGVDSGTGKRNKSGQKDTSDFKRLNKNRPRELSSKRQVPFLGAELRTTRKRDIKELRDPRFDEKSGTYDTASFKNNYKFLSKIRQKEVVELKKELTTTAGEERQQLKQTMQRLINKNTEDRTWHAKQKVLKGEQQEIQKAIAEGRQPHYTTKKERRTKELVQRFEQLKQTGKLNKHLEKRRKKNVAKDRKRIGFD